MFATEQCLLVLTHHPAVWHQAAQYLDQTAKILTEKGVRIKTNNQIPLNFYVFS
jgi:cleavage stimulation factor subunit 3